ncbi:MAG: hemolysin III family protein [Oscillospiraceae bacterium]|nr:hemolysin III family protein [Oscillospiraceae bacterium]
MKRIIREPFSSISHLIGFIAAIPILLVLVMKSQNAYSAIAFVIFGVALMLLYGASASYHGINGKEKTTNLLRRIDHMMIFILIAGTYTPICLISLRGSTGYILFALIWFCAILGILFKIFWMDAPRWVSTAIYVFMGWLAVFAFYPIIRSVSIAGFGLILLGGLFYTVGAVIYGLEWPKITTKYFGFHELFHVFVLFGSAVHVLFMFVFVL